MPAGLLKYDSMFSVYETPWHGLGAVLKKRPKSIDEAIIKAGLDWEVCQAPLRATINGKSQVIEGYFVNYRADTGEPLGIVTTRYTPVQNRDAFSFLANLFGSEMHFETAGSLMNGRRAWVMMKVPEYVEVGGDPIGQFAFISNSHDGKSSVIVALTPVRIVCMNTLGAAVRLAKGANAQRTYTLRHLGNMSQKIAEARNVLEVTINYYEQFKQVGDKMAQAKLSDKSASKLLEELLPTKDLGDRAAANRVEAREAVMRLFKEGTEVNGVNTLGNSPGTAWGFYNAATEFADHAREERKEGGNFQRSIDDPDGFKKLSWNLSLSAAKLVA